LGSFQEALLADCAKHPNQALFDALTAVKTSKPDVKASKPAK
jgi:hypothetical protein